MKFIRLKEIGSYTLRIVAFLLSLRYLYLRFITLFFVVIFYPIRVLDKLLGALNLFSDLSDDISYIIAFWLIFTICGFAAIITAYLLAKICGVFKELDDLKKWQSFIVVILISVFAFIYIYIDKNNNEDIVFPCICTISVIAAYITYILFGYLTKKHPKPFEKIGYYSSLEFYKNAFKKIFNR